MAFKLTTEEWVEKANKIHNNFYNYSNVNYLGATIKVEIICPIHGEFSQNPSNHTAGSNCPKCARNGTISKQTKTINQFISEANIIHDNFYDYSKSIYLGAKEKIIIICKNHGEFSQEASSHLVGSGCPKCNKISSFWNDTTWQNIGNKSKNFDSFKVYIIKIFNDDETFFKIGKTFRTIDKRFKSRFSIDFGYEIEIVKIFESKNNGIYISKLERKLISENKINKYEPLNKFGGSNECFKKINKNIKTWQEQ